MRRITLAMAACTLPLAACTFTEADENHAAPTETGTAAAEPAASAMGSNDARPAAEDKPRPLMQAQVVLDRLGFTPGVVDGKMGMSTVNAIKGFQEARGLTVSGELDEPTRQALAQWQQIPATRVVTIPAEFANDQYVQIPEDRKLQAKMERLGYASLGEKLAERFHTTEAVLAELNPQLAGGAAPAAADPGATGNMAGAVEENSSAAAPEGKAATPKLNYRAGMQLRVPNIGADRFDPAAVKDAEMGRDAADARGRHRAAAGRQHRGRQVRPGAARARRAGQVARPVHRDDGVGEIPAADRHVEDPGHRIQSRMGL